MANDKLIYAGSLLQALIDNGWLKLDMTDSAEMVAVQAIIDDAPAIDAIPIDVIKRKIDGVAAADGCDQAGPRDLSLRIALVDVLGWYKTPDYEQCERRCRPNDK